MGCKAIHGARSVVLLACTAALVAAQQQLLMAQNQLPSSRRYATRLPAAAPGDQAPTAAPQTSAPLTPVAHVQPLPPPPPESIPQGAAGPQESERCYSLEQLEAMALANNPTLVQAAAQVRAAQGQWLQSGLRPNPIAGYQASEVGNEGLSGQQGAFISQEIVRRRKLQLSRTANSRAVVQAQQGLVAQRWRVLNDVRSEFFNVLVAQRALELTQELVEIGRRGVETTQNLFRGEQIAYVDVLQAHVEFDAAQIALENARNRQAAAWRRLAADVGVPSLVACKLTGDLRPPAEKLDFEQTLSRLLAESPELASAWAGVARARATLERARVEPRPNVVAQLGIQRDNHTHDTIGNVQIGIPLPILDANQGNIQTAFADLRNAQAEVGRVELSLRNRLASAFETYSNARNQVDKYAQDILPDSRKALDLIAKGYEQQQFSFLTLLTAQRTFAQASLAYLQALQQLGVSRVAIEGLMLTGALREEHAIDVPQIETGIAPVFGPGRPPVEVR